jgi:hypothetical protein
VLHLSSNFPSRTSWRKAGARVNMKELQFMEKEVENSKYICEGLNIN